MKHTITSRKVLSGICNSYIAICLLTGFTILSALFLSSSIVSADDDSVVDEINITVPVSCTMSGTGMNTHNANVNNGTYTPNIGTTTLKAFCNDSEGFAIYAAGYTGNEIGATNSNKLVGTAASNNAVIETGINTSGNTSNWAMKLSVVSSPTPTYSITIDSDTNGSFSSYHIVPNEYTKVAHRDSGTDIGESAEGVTLNTTYAAYISKTQPADTYSGQVIYTLVYPASETPLSPKTAQSGCINYFPNGFRVVGTMGCQPISASDTSATLLASNFSRTGYGFAGWSDVFDYATNPNAHFYGPNEYITFTAGQYTGANPGLSLYAVWAKSAGYLQDTNKVAELCDANTGSLVQAPINGTANLSSVSALTDQRDSQTYAIAKLADGKCWMIENLRLDDTASHNSDGVLAQGYGGDFIGLANPEYANFNSTEPPKENSLYYSGTQSGTASIDIGTNQYPRTRMPRYNDTNTSNRASNPNSNNANIFSYGNYYSWAATIASTSYNNNTIGNEGSTSLCPTGWRLPRGGNKSIEVNNDFWNLIVNNLNGGTKPNNYDSESRPYYTGDEAITPTRLTMSYPNNFIGSGDYNNASSVNQGSSYYWTSSSQNGTNAKRLHIGLDYLDAGVGYSNKYMGMSIRCLAPPNM